ncbi:hypothetical protein JKP88DRAFT_287956 [Tribonema minus]|uniref:Ankyrin repeat protein n=1 Tax=Tribonema minus TaxID=303371 RepID=A0A835Z6N4_9STRA|nr:hypothetical protein JKP88DRAFT_287956 [Tribonema minus]
MQKIREGRIEVTTCDATVSGSNAHVDAARLDSGFGCRAFSDSKLATVCRDWKAHWLAAANTPNVPQRYKERTTAAELIGGSVEACEWLHDDGWPLMLGDAIAAAKRGRFEGPTLESIASAAALKGRVDMLEYLMNSGVPCDEEACESAALGGHLRALQWLRARGVPWSVETAHAAAARGDVSMLEWIKEAGGAWSQVTCACAADEGHLDVLKWLHANGCPLTELTPTRAASGGHRHVIEWAVFERGVALLPAACLNAARYGFPDLLKWLRLEMGAPWEASVYARRVCNCAAFNDCVAVLAWARANGAVWSEETVYTCVQRGSVACLRWCLEHGCPVDWELCLCWATGEVAELLMQHMP